MIKSSADGAGAATRIRNFHLIKGKPQLPIRQAMSASKTGRTWQWQRTRNILRQECQIIKHRIFVVVEKA